MVHLAIDTPEDWCAEGTETIEELIREHAFGGLEVAREEIQSETLAEVAAIELLYPFEFRAADLASQESLSALSVRYQIPEYAIGRALAPSYMKLATELWTKVGGHMLGGIGSEPVKKKARKPVRKARAAAR
jgi:hypothetical protein